MASNWQERLDVETFKGGIPLWKHVTAGSAAGAIEHLVSFPFEKYAHRQHLKLAGHKDTTSFFKGLIPTVVGSIPAHALMFSTFEKVKEFGFKSVVLRKYQEELAGMCSQIAHDLVDTPSEYIQHNVESGEYSSSLKCLKDHLNGKKPIKALFAGLPLALSLGIPESVLTTHLTTRFTKMFKVDQHMDPSTSAPNAKTLLGMPLKGLFLHFSAHGVAGAVSTALMTPFENVKHQINESSLENKSTKLVPNISALYKEMGWRGFTSGMLPRCAGAVPEAVLAWGTFELTERLLRAVPTKYKKSIAQ